MNGSSFLILVCALLITLTTPALAQPSQTQKPLGTFGVWQAYSFNEGTQRVCYMSATAHFPTSKKFKRGASYLMITHRPSDNSKDVVSYASGYNFKPLSEVQISIGKTHVAFFTQKDTAWSHDTLTDKALAKAIRTGKTVQITGVPAQKSMPTLTDNLNLKGADLAYQTISKACGIEVEPLPVQATAPKKKVK